MGSCQSKEEEYPQQPPRPMHEQPFLMQQYHQQRFLHPTGPQAVQQQGIRVTVSYGEPGSGGGDSCETSVKIKPDSGGASNAWEWNGKKLKPCFGGSTNAWEFNGSKFKPCFGGATKALEWKNGNTMKPYFGGASEGWEWRGNTFKPCHGGSTDAWELVGGGRRVKPCYGGAGKGWEASGEVSKKVWAGFILAVARN